VTLTRNLRTLTFGALSFTILLFAAAAGAAAPPSLPSPGPARTQIAADGREAYIVVFHVPSLARTAGQSRARVAPAAASEPEAYALRLRQDDFARDMGVRIPRFRAGQRYVRVLNGMAVLVPKGGLATLQADSRVRAVFPIRKYRLHLDASNNVMNAPAFWTALGGDQNAGKGIKIADLDTGVDFSNPMFTDASLPMPDGFPRENDGHTFANSKVIVAKYFQGIIDAEDPLLSTSHRTAEDLSGHGSHTASVAAGAKVTLSGSGRRPVTLEGVAPKAYIGDYKVFSPNAFTDNIIAAIEAATADGMNVLNMSFGISNQDGTEPFLFSASAEDEAIQNAIAAGMVITVSAGNSGQDSSGNPNPDSISAMANVPEVIAVGASTNSHDGIAASELAEVSMTSGHTTPPENVTHIIGAQGEHTDINGNPTGPAFPTTAFSAPFSDLDQLDGSDTGLACFPPGASLTGQVVLVQRGTCSFATKVQSMQARGAIGVVIYNKADGSDGGDQTLIPDIGSTTIPAIFIGRTDGLNLKAYLDANGGNPPSAQGTFGPAPPGSPSAVFSTQPHDLASFSSIGPTIDLQIKPDLVTVGTGSYAAVQDDSAKGDGRFNDDETDPSPFFDPSGFAFGQGTSFAAPRAAGSAALVKQKHPDWTPAEIKAALMETSARPTDASDPLRIGGLSVLQRGSGEIDLAAASSVGSIVLPASYSYRRVAFDAPPPGNALDRVFTLENRTGSSVTYTLTAAASAAHSDHAVTPSVSPAAMTLGPGESGTFTLSLSLGAALQHGITDSEGEILVSDGGVSIPGSLSVPYFVRVAFPAGHGPVLRSASPSLSVALDSLDLSIAAHDDDADLSTFSVEFYDAQGEDLGGGTGSLSVFGVDTSHPDVSGDIVLSQFDSQAGIGCIDCVTVAVSVTDALGNRSNTIVSRFRGAANPEAVPASSGGAYQRSIPLVAHIQGAQFLFRSDVRLFNPSADHILTLDSYFVPQGQSGANAIHVAHQILPRQSFALDDIVSNDYKLSTGIGSLVVVSSDGNPFVASSRAYDANSAGGTFGTFAGSATPAAAVGSGDGTVSANGFPTQAGFHTNVGATEATGVDANVRFDGFDTAGAPVGSFTQVIPAYSNVQFNPSADATHPFSAPAARVSFTVLSGGRILPYAAAVDELSGDTLLSLASKAPESSDDVLLTGAGHVHGALGTIFTSDLSITNASAGPRTVDLTLIAAGQASPPSPPAPLTLSAGQTVVLADALQNSFGFTTDAVGGIRIHPETPASIVASVRTTTPNNNGGGSYGFFLNGLKAADAVAAGKKAVSIHLENDSRFRTNFGFTEIAGAPVTVRATFFDENGSPLGTHSYPVAAGSFSQKSAAELLGAATAGNGYIEFTIDSGSGAVLPFATVVDNLTGDAIYVPGELEP
jgi:subtilisin family serine protease